MSSMRQKRFRKPIGNKLAQTSVDNALSQLQVFRNPIRTGTETGLIFRAKRLEHSLQYRLIPLIVTFGLMSDPFNPIRVGGKHGIQVGAPSGRSTRQVECRSCRNLPWTLAHLIVTVEKLRLLVRDGLTALIVGARPVQFVELGRSKLEEPGSFLPVENLLFDNNLPVCQNLLLS